MKVNYMKMIMAKGVFKMRAAGAGKGVCVCVRAFECVCNLLCEGGALLPPSLPPRPALQKLPPHAGGNERDETSLSFSSSIARLSSLLARITSHLRSIHPSVWSHSLNAGPMFSLSQ